jgi:hypothetical protein
MGTKRVVLVAGDVLQSRIATKLAVYIQQLGCDTEALLGDGAQPPPYTESEITDAVLRSEVVVATISDYAIYESLAARTAAAHGKPLALLALGWGGWQHPSFEEVRGSAALLFVSDDHEARAAAAFFPNAQIVPLYHPELEECFSPARNRLSVRSTLGIQDHQHLVLVSGEKEAIINLPLAAMALEALCDHPQRDNFRVVFAIHPGHAPMPMSLIDFYGHELSHYKSQVDVRVSCKGDPFGIGAPDMVAGTDLVIGTNSTLQLQAACLRIPAIAILLRPAFRNRVLSAGDTWWPPCAHGAVAPVYPLCTTRVKDLITDLLEGPSAALMREAQESMFPRRGMRSSLHKAAEELIRL